MPLVSALNIYPVKSLHRREVDTAKVERLGLAGDRRWMVVKPDGTFLTQRQFPPMALIRVDQGPDGIILEAASGGAIAVPMPPADAPRLDVTVWRSTLNAAVAGEATNGWLSAALGREVRLVYMDDEDSRPVDPEHADADDRVGFADGYPLLLAAEASLDDLNTRLEAPIPMTRFRPNIVVSGSDAWAEDGWRRVRIGAVTFRVALACARCIVTSIDQESAERKRPDEPLRTLASFRRADGGVYFGQNLIPESFGTVSVGDTLEVLETGPSNLPRAV